MHLIITHIFHAFYLSCSTLLSIHSYPYVFILVLFLVLFLLHLFKLSFKLNLIPFLSLSHLIIYITSHSTLSLLSYTRNSHLTKSSSPRCAVPPPHPPTLLYPTLSLPLNCTPFYVMLPSPLPSLIPSPSPLPSLISSYSPSLLSSFYIHIGIFGGFEADPLMCGAFQGAHLAIPAFVAALCCTTAYILLPPKPSSGTIFSYSLSFFWKRKRKEGLYDSNNESYGSYGGVSSHSQESNTLTGNLHLHHFILWIKL